MNKRIAVAAAVLLAGCAATNNKGKPVAKEDTRSPENFLGYQAIPPLPVDKVMLYEESTDELKEVYWAAIADEATIRDLLPLQSAQVYVRKTDVSGKMSYLTASVTGETGSYTVTMDYMKYRVEDIVDDASGTSIGNARIGVGLRIEAVLVTSKANLNLGSLLVIGVEAQQGNLRGGISVDVIGIDSEAVTNLIPLTSEIDQTAIQAALQALASIKTKIYEEDTKLTPHLVAIRQTKAGLTQRIKETATTSVRGTLRAQSRKAKQAQILSSIAPAGVFDMAKWDALVDSSDLSAEQKSSLKAFDDLVKITRRLDLDAGMNGTIISALHKAL